MSVDFVKSREQYTFAPSKCLFLNDLSLRIYLGKINHTFSKNLDFTMLPRIKTKTNLIAPYSKKRVNETTFWQCLHTRMAVYFEETFRRIERYVILYVFNIVSILFSVQVLWEAAKMALFGTCNSWFLTHCTGKSDPMTPNFHYISKQNTCLTIIWKRKIKK